MKSVATIISGLALMAAVGVMWFTTPGQAAVAWIKDVAFLAQVTLAVLTGIGGLLLGLFVMLRDAA